MEDRVFTHDVTASFNRVRHSDTHDGFVEHRLQCAGSGKRGKRGQGLVDDRVGVGDGADVREAVHHVPLG